MQVSGKTTIFRNDHESSNGKWYSYATGVSNKRQDGSYVNAYLEVKFKNGVVVENKSKIDIKNGFLTVREYTLDGESHKKIVLMVLDFDIEDGGAGHVGAVEGFSALAEEEVPF